MKTQNVIQEKSTKEYNGVERRKIERTPLQTFCPSILECNGTKYSALMMNLSEDGAMFRMNTDIEVGKEIQISIKTPYGKSECKGKVIWTKLIGEFYQTGIEFTELSKDYKDSLICFIDSPF